jgi:type I restriction enzyme, S subunit
LIKPNQEIIKGEFLVSFLNSRFGILQSNAMILKTTVEHVNIEDIRKFRVAIPPIREQKLISKRIQNVSEIVDTLNKYRDSLSDLKIGLMQKLLTGKRRVKV